MSEKVTVTEETPESLGWKRRADLDTPSGGPVYELPDGEIYAFPPGRQPRVAVQHRDQEEPLRPAATHH